MNRTNEAPGLIITPQILSLVAGLDEFKGQWLTLGNLPPLRLSALEQQAQTSAAAAWFRRNNAEKPPAKEVAAHTKVRRLLGTSFAGIPFTQHHIKQLHRVLAPAGGATPGGEYRREEAEAIGRRMHHLVTWVDDTLAARQLHPLLVIGIFLLRFGAIRPFAEDNQRLAHLLVMLLLLKNDYEFIRYHALELIFEEQQALHAQAMATGQSRLSRENIIAEEWLVAFLRILHLHKDAVRAAVATAHGACSRPALEQQILDLLHRHGQATNKTIQAATGASRNTIKARLGRLVANGELIRHGHGKGSRYTLAGPA